MKLNLQKKHSFWHLYKKWIIRIASTASVLGIIGGTTYVYTNFKKEICEWLSSLDWHSISLLIHYIGGFTTVSVFLYLIYIYGKFLVRQQFIPLSEIELKNNGIKTIAEYSLFLQKYLIGFKPLREIHKLCFISSFRYLLSNDQRKQLFEEAYFVQRIPTWQQREKAIANILATPMNNNESNKTESILDEYFKNEIERYSFREDAMINPFAHIENMTFFKRHKLAKFIIPILITSVLLLALSSISLIYGLAVLKNVITTILLAPLIVICLFVFVAGFPNI